MPPKNPFERVMTTGLKRKGDARGHHFSEAVRRLMKCWNVPKRTGSSEDNRSFVEAELSG